MSKRRKGKKKWRKRLGIRIPSVTTVDRHHICFQKRYWSNGYAKAICMAFVRYVPVTLHRQLHGVLKNVPLPPSEMLQEAWRLYQENKAEIDSYNVARAAAWLYVNIPDTEFRQAMQVQIDFFATRLAKD